jgi:pimeloyl-ACP methyl ester carboxylesterase
MSIEGHWAGVMVRAGAKLKVTFNFLRKAKGLEGNFSSATQGVMDYPLNLVRYEHPNVHLELGDGAIVFDGRYENDSTMTGTFKEGDAEGTFSLNRANVEPLPYKMEEVRFQNGPVVLSASLLVPNTKGPHPAIIFLHGSGPESRWGSARFRADGFARRGIAALIYDKRGAGASSGDWKVASFEDLADDAIAGLHFLQTRKEINPRQIGIYGHSQGGFLAPLVATRSNALAFVISAASYAGPAYEQDIYRVRNSLRKHGYSDEEVKEAMEMYTIFIDVARSGQGWEQYEAAIQKSRNKRWFAFLEIPPRDDWLWQHYRPIGNFNSLPYWEKVRVPILLIYGERDELVPPLESLTKIEQALKKAGNEQYTAVLIPKAAHNLAIFPDPVEPFSWWHVAPGANDLMIAWVRLRF